MTNQNAFKTPYSYSYSGADCKVYAWFDWNEAFKKNNLNLDNFFKKERTETTTTRIETTVAAYPNLQRVDKPSEITFNQINDFENFDNIFEYDEIFSEFKSFIEKNIEKQTNIFFIPFPPAAPDFSFDVFYNSKLGHFNTIEEYLLWFSKHPTNPQGYSYLELEGTSGNSLVTDIKKYFTEERKVATRYLETPPTLIDVQNSFIQQFNSSELDFFYYDEDNNGQTNQSEIFNSFSNLIQGNVFKTFIEQCEIEYKFLREFGEENDLTKFENNIIFYNGNVNSPNVPYTNFVNSIQEESKRIGDWNKKTSLFEIYSILSSLLYFTHEEITIDSIGGEYTRIKRKLNPADNGHFKVKIKTYSIDGAFIRDPDFYNQSSLDESDFISYFIKPKNSDSLKEETIRGFNDLMNWNTYNTDEEGILSEVEVLIRGDLLFEEYFVDSIEEEYDIASFKESLEERLSNVFINIVTRRKRPPSTFIDFPKFIAYIHTYMNNKRLEEILVHEVLLEEYEITDGALTTVNLPRYFSEAEFYYVLNTEYIYSNFQLFERFLNRFITENNNATWSGIDLFSIGIGSDYLFKKFNPNNKQNSLKKFKEDTNYNSEKKYSFTNTWDSTWESIKYDTRSNLPILSLNEVLETEGESLEDFKNFLNYKKNNNFNERLNLFIVDVKDIRRTPIINLFSPDDTNEWLEFKNYYVNNRAIEQLESYFIKKYIQFTSDFALSPPPIGENVPFEDKFAKYKFNQTSLIDSIKMYYRNISNHYFSNSIYQSIASNFLNKYSEKVLDYKNILNEKTQIEYLNSLNSINNKDYYDYLTQKQKYDEYETKSKSTRRETKETTTTTTISEVDEKLKKWATGLTALDSLATISLSIHDAKAPVRRLGHVGVSGFTKAVRTIAGTMVFLIIEDHPLRELMAKDPSLSLGENSGNEKLRYSMNYWSYDSDNERLGRKSLGVDGQIQTGDIFIDKVPAFLSALLTPFNLLLRYQTEVKLEVDRGKASMIIEGIEITGESIVTSVNDMVTEVVVQFVAKDVYQFTGSGAKEELIIEAFNRRR